MPMTGGLSSPPAAMHCVGTQSGSGMFGTPQPTALESLLDSSSLTKTYTVYSNGMVMYIYIYIYIYRWQRVKTSHKQNAQCSGNTKNVSQQTRNRVFATSIFAIFIDFAFEF